MRRLWPAFPVAILLPVAASHVEEGQWAAAGAQVPQEQRIEIVIRNSDFLLTQPAAVQLGTPTVIILRNQDIIRHGFTSPMFAALPVAAESEGMTAYGDGLGGFYINPDKTLVIRFTPEQPGQYGFRCDLHPQMKGEVFLMELGQT